jgi:glycogen debranching enzyme
MPDPPRRTPEARLALPSTGETEPLVLSHGNAFCVLSRRGDITPPGARDLGLFHDDMRHLSHLELSLSGGPAVVLSSDTAGATYAQTDLTLTDREFGGFLDDPQNFLHVRRKQLLDGDLVEQIVLTNHLRRPIELWVELRLGADFADVFEVRGARRQRRGTLLPPEPAEDRLTFGYHGLDGVVYRTLVRFEPSPRRIDASGARWELRLSPGEATLLQVVVQPSRGPTVEPHAPRPFDVRLDAVRGRHQRFVHGAATIVSDHGPFDQALRYDLEDLDALRLQLGDRAILGAGIPWFAAPFGRDAIITSLELLSVAPQLAVETLRTLAAYQGVRDDPWREEEPGKILHELRRGEMAHAGEIPHSPYYGSVDATPLWLLLAGETWRWLGDRALVDELMPHAERALGWIDRRLRLDGGFLRYQRVHEKGLVNQGWKDSRDGVSFPDGRIADPPIALVEVQGYVVAAWNAMALLCDARGAAARARELRARALELRAAIRRAFWVEETRYFALALDGRDGVVPTITSNPGHLLFCDAAGAEDAARIIELLRSDGMYTGWGIRTLARGQAVFNPLSYHNGSVWPHDNALIAFGAARQGHSDAALQLLEGIFLAAQHFRRARLPELFCGLARAEGDFLVHYPVSCSPQAWASGAFFLLLQACLGLHPDAPRRRLIIRNPRLPGFLNWLDLRGLRVGGARVSLHFARHGSRTHADLLEVSGDPLQVHIEIG